MASRILIIDRIEGDFAVVEYGEDTYQISIHILPDAKEGDLLEISTINPNTKQAQERLVRLKSKSSFGDGPINI